MALSSPKKKATLREIIPLGASASVAGSADHKHVHVKTQTVLQKLLELRSLDTTSLFEDSLDREIAQLDNPLIRWEVGRSIYSWNQEDKRKVLASDIPSDPRHLKLRSIIPGSSIEDEFDTTLSTVIDQLENEMQANTGDAPLSPIDKLVRSGEIRFAIELNFGDQGLILKPKNARIIASNELLRSYGSDCWIQVQLHSSLLFRIQWEGRSQGIGDEVWQFFHRALKFAGRIYRSALVKNDSVWFFTSPLECPRPIRVVHMIEKQLPLELNPRMKISKFNARLQLGLSTTIPSITFKPEEIRRVPDICSNSLRISKELMTDIAARLELSYLPSAIQGAYKVVKARYVGQQYAWALFDPAGLPNDFLIEVWRNDHMCSSKEEVLTFEFMIPMYQPSSARWENRECELTIPRNRTRLIMNKRCGEAVMTDGAAAISWGAALKVQTALRLRYLPAAYQARILKAKGLWYLSRDGDQKGHWIEIRTSQWKAEVMCQPHESPAFNICHVSSRARPGHLNRQSIPVLVSRNVPITAVTDLQRENFREVSDSLTSTVPERLAQTLESHGYLLSIKAERLATATNTLARKSQEEIKACWEKYSNRPHNPIEEAIELLKSGFSVRNERFIDRLVLSGRSICDRMMNFKVEVPRSVSVLVIPDPTGTLQEGEVFLQLSQFSDPKTSLPITILKSECIVSRSPCVLPTDARKVKAVFNSHLICYQDVLVCSIFGKQSLLNYLSGGDYDGDVVHVIWDDSFTKDFSNADDVKHIPQFQTYNSFFADRTKLSPTGKGSALPTMKVQDFIDLKKSRGTYTREFARAQLISLFQPVDFGRYSRMYQVCEYLRGLNDELTMKLGYVYVKCLDASKQGVFLKAEADQALKDELEHALSGSITDGVIPLPPWTAYLNLAENAENREWCESFDDAEKKYLPLNKHHPLEALASTARLERQSCLDALKSLEVDFNNTDLSAPWHSFESKVKERLIPAGRLYDFIKSNVTKSIEQYKQISKDSGGKVERLNLERAARTFWVEGKYSNALAAVEHDPYSYHFLRGKNKVGYNILRASALVAITPKKDFFPFYVVFNELCHLRATAEESRYHLKSGVRRTGHCPRVLDPEFCQAMTVKLSFLAPDMSRG